MGAETLILCQPDDKKGCSACCGLFNFKDTSKQHLTQFLNTGCRRSSEHRNSGTDTNTGNCFNVREATSYICPHQGFIFHGRPGCLLHPRYGRNSGRNNSFFGEKICESFLCPAHSILDEEQKKIIMTYIDDWYYYAVAVIDPASIHWFLALLTETYHVDTNGSDLFKKTFSDFLGIHARYLLKFSGSIFFYSVSEYNIGKKNFSLISDANHLEQEKYDIRAAIETSL